MQLSSPTIFPLLFLLGFCHLTTAFIELQTIRNLTIITDECRERITSLGDVSQAGAMARVLGGGTGQSVLRSGGGDDEDEIEETVTASLRTLCSSLLLALEEPLPTPSPAPALANSDPISSPCHPIKQEYHFFLASTVKLLYEVQERQMYWHWQADSGVFDGVAWLQALWASRKANSQDRSFIEQQLALYSTTGCFGKNEVLRRDVEIVEYMNDLIDSFR